MATGGRLSPVEPVFLRQRDFPSSVIDDKQNALNICLAAERVTGKETIHGAQAIRGLWRIYPLTKTARDLLLLEGVELGGQSLTLHGRNPFILNSSTGAEIPTTKLWVSDLPISIDNNDIESALVRVGCVLRSKLIMEKMRTREGTLTRFVTGRRFVFINVPSKPLERLFKVGSFTARLYYKELPSPDRRPQVCSRCLQPGHHVSSCQNLVTCRACHMSGHKQGDPTCTAFPGGSIWDLPNRSDFTLGDLIDQRKEDKLYTQENGTEGEGKKEEDEENEEDAFQDTSSDFALPVAEQSAKKDQFHTPAATYSVKKKSVNKPASNQSAQGSLTPGKRPRSPFGDSPSTCDASAKQGRLDEDTCGDSTDQDSACGT